MKKTKWCEFRKRTVYDKNPFRAEAQSPQRNSQCKFNHFELFALFSPLREINNLKIVVHPKRTSMRMNTMAVIRKFANIRDSYNKNFTFYFLLFTSYFFFSCNPTKKLSEGEYLLEKNRVIDKSYGIDKSDAATYIKQKPNRKVLLWTMYLHIYNSINREKLGIQNEKCDAKVEAKLTRRNEKILKKNEALAKKGKPLKKIAEKKEIYCFCEAKTGIKQWWLGIGEPPVVYDSVLAKKSSRQIKLFLNNKGFFNSTVKDSVSVTGGKRIKSFYVIHEGTPYTFRNVSYDIKDDRLNYFVLASASGSLITRGTNYDVDVLQQERARITTILRNDGYYFFSKEYIYFEVDSSLKTHEVDITFGIKNPVVRVEGEQAARGGDSTREGSHERYYIGNIYIHTDYDTKLKTAPRDTLVAGDYRLLYNGVLHYKTRMLTDAMYHSKGELFQQSDVDQTYKRLTELKLFRSVQLLYTFAGGDKLDCNIYLSRIPKQSFTASTEGTNAGEIKGISGSITWQNKNTMKGGEILELKLKGGLEVQKATTNNENVSVAGIESPFNTLELGSEAGLKVPRFLTPFKKLSGTQSNNAKTNFTGSYNYQQRALYVRSIGNLSYGYSWKETPTKQHLINPIEFNVVNVYIKDPGFQSIIDNSTDLFLKNSYSRHLTLGTRYGFVFNNQEITKKKNYTYLRVGAEGAGNAMYGIFRALEQTGNNVGYVSYDTVYSNDGKSYSREKNYTLDSIRFSQYVRGDFDYRYYKHVGEKDKLVFRIACGVGKPLYNLRVLPLEKSFFSGGPNSVRAWQSRTLGPGKFADETSAGAADKIGDVKLEGNFEYRFNVVKAFNAALFMDAGNIWLRKKYTSYPGGEINAVNFINQIAIGAGAGIRFDFNFFIIRLDGSFKVKDPEFLSDSQTLHYDRSPYNNNPWVFTHIFEAKDRKWNTAYKSSYGHNYSFFVLNFGIGYPF